jgi:hypothetical protein
MTYQVRNHQVFSPFIGHQLTVRSPTISVGNGSVPFLQLPSSGQAVSVVSPAPSCSVAKTLPPIARECTPLLVALC